MSSSTDSGSRMVFQLHIPGSKICTECILSSINGQMLAIMSSAFYVAWRHRGLKTALAFHSGYSTRRAPRHSRSGPVRPLLIRRLTRISPFGLFVHALTSHVFGGATTSIALYTAAFYFYPRRLPTLLLCPLAGTPVPPYSSSEPPVGLPFCSTAAGSSSSSDSTGRCSTTLVVSSSTSVSPSRAREPDPPASA
jgi:hypothetical protein